MTKALFLYTTLSNKCPTDTLYSLRLGILYDQLNKDRYAKSYYNRAIQTNNSLPEPYFYFGEFYFKRKIYRKALKMYLKAYDNGYSKDTRVLNRLNCIYTMFGDMENASYYPVQEE